MNTDVDAFSSLEETYLRWLVQLPLLSSVTRVQRKLSNFLLTITISGNNVSVPLYNSSYENWSLNEFLNSGIQKILINFHPRRSKKGDRPKDAFPNPFRAPDHFYNPVQRFSLIGNIFLPF